MMPTHGRPKPDADWQHNKLSLILLAAVVSSMRAALASLWALGWLTGGIGLAAWTVLLVLVFPLWSPAFLLGIAIFLPGLLSPLPGPFRCTGCSFRCPQDAFDPAG